MLCSLDTGEVSVVFAALTQRAGWFIVPLSLDRPALFSHSEITGVMSDFEEFEKQLSENRQGKHERFVCAPNLVFKLALQRLHSA